VGRRYTRRVDFADDPSAAPGLTRRTDS